MFSPPLQDDHVWLTVAGEGWAIRRWRPPILYLWRGYMRVQYCVLDTSDVDWENYCNRAAELINNQPQEKQNGAAV